ncbi:bifunctional tRNA (5-methylaminomethyl-2-thiouridine)(34)-methyltransferase MnmD/FAD-dependent 5-carboxymethylaminomethyl-2-thiouridine(34) oxidoreductase MnmC [Marinomonas ostreistagni]|uniref:tRNA 5-methylaminomethyl-2-thiouridine biosynthesis bifunctional protein MnmC n=1 Tax=Marinomonas ostreistagni TaxID=359209 RepID=A0ABS0Z6J3_9GAMM|nr:bifunctional tRNA (5-methylaminomethyl-2-thiouridine)(34)-methyltransferase MnmD/FAD-dependent 5-carboxymethylaminomethyl-2-thiouridine(34) oxidoreductase MnmC [Marinomonas ostreistagni]MBJ7549283.1 bifunctional tRNA (5-methylaminomethyl-2-thiouridine)(34)-methyltransferase MnmD/FAD-dependent 5-carboxymethylaminomethyl-2-thiouridine(34) oxidoreductase MnmC [Marinomonas ostreistagni]
MLTSYKLEPPALNFGEDGVPRSSAFDDVYFDKDAGLDETRYVFLEHNLLSERFSSLSPHQRFTIAETGFGTGLNFLCAWQLFLEQSPNDSWLHFVSVEKYPLSKDKLEQSLAMWPSLKQLAQPLVAKYPVLCHGLHTLFFPEQRTTLTLWFGEASEGFKALNGQVDAWFLDGFAPSKNPDMWSDELFQNIQRLSIEGSTFATFTAAGIVRRGLKSHGFDVQKVKGFGHKREMMIGSFIPTESESSHEAPWFVVKQQKTINKVLVVGSGIAGATTAHALAEKGIPVEVWEQGNNIACGGSGNAQGMLYPKLSVSDTPLNRFYLTAYLYANRFYNAIGDQTAAWQQCGLLQLPKNENEQTKFSKMLASQLYPDSIIRAHDQGLELPLSGWLKPQSVCEHLLSHKNIQLSLSTQLLDLAPCEAGWQATSQHSTETYSHVVLCTANEQAPLKTWQEWPTKPIRGQVTQLAICDLTSKDQETIKKVSQVLCAEGYLSPALEGQINFGATYDLGDNRLDVLEQSHQDNLVKLQHLLPIDSEAINLANCKGRVAMRCTVADYTPIVGPFSAQKALVDRYAPLRQNAKWLSNETGELLTGLYINVGHGSRGLVSAPLCGFYISSLILNEITPLEQTVIETLHPNRFTIRQLKRGEV